MRIDVWIFRGLWLLALVCMAGRAAEAPITEPATAISGSLLIHGGGKLSARALDVFLKLAGGANARIVVIASDNVAGESGEPQIAGLLKTEGAVVVGPLQIDKSDEDAVVGNLKTATGVWLCGGSKSGFEKFQTAAREVAALHDVLARGGIIGGSSAGAAAMSQVMLRNENDGAKAGAGLNLLPGVAICPYYLKHDRSAQMAAVLADHPGLAGLGIDEGTALVVRGRQMGVLGESTVTLCLSPSAKRPALKDPFKEGEMLDLTALTRAAIARAGPVFPSATPSVPEVAGKGTLVIVGGGYTPRAAEQRFIQSAGGPDAPIAIISTALGDDPPADPIELKMLMRAGAKNLKVLHAHNPKEAGDAKFLASLKDARGIWFCGGRQWRLVDSYLDTPAEKLMHEVLERGGAIGGSSAGATIQGEYLVRGNPLGNVEMMAEGYERGFAFLKGVGIDQHFAQRNRFADMTLLKKTFPKVTGLGIDQDTAIVVTGHVMEVVGPFHVHVYDREKPAADGEKEYQTVMSGEFYDFKLRQKVAKPQ